jgi:hypothetical protein
MGTLKVIQVTQQEIQDAMKRSVYKSKKDYTRKLKHKHKNFN